MACFLAHIQLSLSHHKDRYRTDILGPLLIPSQALISLSESQAYHKICN